MWKNVILEQVISISVSLYLNSDLQFLNGAYTDVIEA